MLVVAKSVQEAYAHLLSSRGIPGKEHHFFQKWLRFYLDFCNKYHHPVAPQSSLHAFIEKLSEKEQPESAKRQAWRAVQLYQDSLGRRPESFGNKQKKLKGLHEKRGGESSKPADGKKSGSGARHGCSWAKEFQELEATIRMRHYSTKTLKSYSGYIRKFQAYTKSLDPRHLTADHVREFLTHLAVDKDVSASTQNLAFNSLLFFFRHILNKEFGQIEGVVRAKKRPYIPVVLSREEIEEILAVIDPDYRLIIKLLYGCGLRLFECLNLRIQCLNFAAGMLTIHDGKGQKDRTVPIPEVLQDELKNHLQALRKLHARDLEKGYKGVFLFDAMERKYKSASREFIWQWLFPAKQLTRDKKSNEMKRYHLHATHVQKALRRSAKEACLTKRVTAHTFRHSFASHLLQNNYDIRTIQELLGHSDVRTTMIYTHTVKSRTLKEARSPLDF